MRLRLSAVVGGAVLALAALVAGAVPAGAAAPTPFPTVTCPPVIPLTGTVAAATETSLTISYSIFIGPPCGYDPPVTVVLFGSVEDARQWLNPVAEGVSGPERNGKVTIDGLTPDTPYWYRFVAGGVRDPYVVNAARTAAVRACTATLATQSAWGGGFVATVTVRNVGTDPLGSWNVSWRWAGDERIVSVWNAVQRDGGTGVLIGNAPYNGTLAPGGSTSFGLLVAAGAPVPGIALTCTR
jgi:cellulase/cellobiase CelA1